MPYRTEGSVSCNASCDIGIFSSLFGPMKTHDGGCDGDSVMKDGDKTFFLGQKAMLQVV